MVDTVCGLTTTRTTCASVGSVVANGLKSLSVSAAGRLLRNVACGSVERGSGACSRKPAGR
jgi:hypothetical protein